MTTERRPSPERLQWAQEQAEMKQGGEYKRAARVFWDELTFVREELACAKVERDGANERARLMLDQKDHFKAEFEKLEAELDKPLAKELKQMRVKFEDADKRADYAWKDGFASAEAGVFGDFEPFVRIAREVVSHWDEFGPEHGFGESLDHLRAAIRLYEEP